MNSQKPIRGAQLNRTHPLSRGLVACYIFNEMTGETVFDSSGNGNNGMLENGVAWGDGGLEFDGVDGYMEVIDSASLDITEDITFVFSFNPYDVSANIHRLIHKNGAYTLYTNSGEGPNTLRLHNYNDNSFAASSASLTSNEYQHIAVSKSGGTVNFCRNGVNIDNDTSITSTFPNSAVNLFIGIDEDLSSYPYGGSFGYIYIYNQSKSSDEMAWLYREPYAMFEPAFNLSALYAAIPPALKPIWYYDMLKRRNR